MIRPYLELVRVPLTPTAVADSFAGYHLAAAALARDPSPWTTAGLASASILIYWMGMATNDLFDREKDRRIHPGRPLPRGAICASHATFVSALLGTGGVLVAGSISAGAALAACGVILLALLYNLGAKRVPLVGNLLMGSCRAGNLLLGALGAASPGELVARGEILLSAGILGAYIAGVTAASLLEDRPPRVESFLATTLPLLLVPAVLVLLAPSRAGAVLNSVLLAGLLGTSILRGARATAKERPAAPESLRAAGSTHPTETFVQAGLGGIFLVDAGLLQARGLARPAIIEYGLLILAWLWGRRWLQSPP